MEDELHRPADDLSAAVRLLLRAAAATPPSHYLLAFLLLLLVFLYNFLEVHLLRDLLRGCRGDRVLLTYNPASDVYHGVAAKCRLLHGRYLATPWLSSPHLQTTFLNFFGNPPRFRYTREIFRALDGGTLALDWLLHTDVFGGPSNRNNAISKEDTTPIVVVIPGLTSDSVASYMKHLVYDIAKKGYNVVVCNHRGLGGTSITSDRFYNAGWTEDMRAVVKHLHQEYPNARIFAIGTSIGANILVKYLGEDGEDTPVAGAASVCSPWDLVIGDRFINRRLVQRFYDRAIAFGLKGYAEMHEPLLSQMANWEGIKRSRSIRDFDNHATCIVAKYETVDTYYRRCSSASFVGNVSVPLLCISALDDPLCTKEAIPWDECRANKNIVLATTTHGGHLAFFKGLTAKKLWWVDAVEEFLSVLHSSPLMHGQNKIPDANLHSSLESVIDKAPYLNIMEDGMVVPVGNDGEVINNLEDSSNSDVSIDQKTFTVERETDRPIVHSTVVNEKVTHQPPESSGQKAPSEYDAKTVQDIFAPVKKSLNQLSRLNSRSMWLLAYIAILTTWPVVGSALQIVFKKKLRWFRG